MDFHPKESPGSSGQNRLQTPPTRSPTSHFRIRHRNQSYRTLDSLKSGFLGQIGKQSTGFDAGGKKTWKDLVDQGYIIAGSPRTVRERLAEAVRTLRCGHLMCLIQIGSMPAELVRNSTQLFAREVMPHVRGLFNEYEDRWSPRPLPPEERAKPASFDAGGARSRVTK